MEHPLKNWIPYKLEIIDNEAYCKWIDTEGINFTHPFFAESIIACKQKANMQKPPRRVHSASTLYQMQQWGKAIDAVAPTVFIFHVSRCGSTLAAQLLGLLNNAISVSETPFLNELLLNQKDLAIKNTIDFSAAYHAAINWYGQKRKGNEQHLFIKTDSWHIMFYAQLRQLYPTTPFVFLYRNPIEILASHQRRRGIQAVPGLLNPAIFGFDAQAIKGKTLDNYLADVLTVYFTQLLAIKATDTNSLFINYNEGASAILQKILAISNMTIIEEKTREIEKRSYFNAKYPNEPFVEPAISAETANFMLATKNLYEALEKKAGFK
jgi:hypothetical protein